MLCILLSLLAVAPAFAFDGYVDITNGTNVPMETLFVSHSDAETWEENLLPGDVLAPGETIRVDLEGYPDSRFDIRAEDQDGLIYTLWQVDTAVEDVILNSQHLDSDSFSGYVDVTNRTGSDILHLYISHENSGSWEEDVLGSDMLEEGETVRVDIDGYPSSVFDIHAEDDAGGSYTVWNVDVAYDDVTITAEDQDQNP